MPSGAQIREKRLVFVPDSMKNLSLDSLLTAYAIRTMQLSLRKINNFKEMTFKNKTKTDHLLEL